MSNKEGIISKLYDKIIFSKYLNNYEDVPPYKEWSAFLDGLPTPKDCIDRSYCKYLCKKYYFSKRKIRIFNVISFLVLCLSRLIWMRSTIRVSDHPRKGVLLLERLSDLDYKDIIPEDLYRQYPDLIVKEFSKQKFGVLCKDAKILFRECQKRYPRDYFFQFLIYKDLAKHSTLIKKYNPSAVAIYASERNVSSAIITGLYEKQNRVFISFMHGDYDFDLVLSFIDFSQYYTWDKEYTQLFIEKMKSRPEQFIEYTPTKLSPKWNLKETKPSYFCTYYFSSESDQAVREIKRIYDEFKTNNLKCKVRPHPRNNTRLELIKECFSEYYIENPADVTLEQSLRETEYVIGLLSTVLHEALIEGRTVVVDDISSPKAYNELIDSGYYMFKKRHMLLSELLDMVKKQKPLENINE